MSNYSLPSSRLQSSKAKRKTGLETVRGFFFLTQISTGHIIGGPTGLGGNFFHGAVSRKKVKDLEKT